MRITQYLSSCKSVSLIKLLPVLVLVDQDEVDAADAVVEEKRIGLAVEVGLRARARLRRLKRRGWYSYSAYMSEYMNMAKARVVNLESVTHQLHFNDRRAFLNSAIRWEKLFGVNCKKI